MNLLYHEKTIVQISFAFKAEAETILHTGESGENPQCEDIINKQPYDVERSAVWRPLHLGGGHTAEPQAEDK